MDRELVQSVNVMPLILIFLVVSKGVTWDKEKKTPINCLLTYTVCHGMPV